MFLFVSLKKISTETRLENCMKGTQFQIKKSLQNLLNQQLMGNAIQHSVKAFFNVGIQSCSYIDQSPF